MLTAPKLKQIATRLSRGDTPDYVEASDIQIVNQACIGSGVLDLSKVKYHNPENIEKISAWIRQNDILINSTGTGTLGRVSLVREDPKKPTFADGHVTLIRDDFQRFHPKFLFYHLSIQQNYLTAICSVGSTNQIELSRSKLGDLELDLPSLPAQEKIADYLDRETAKIDALMAAKKRLLELLAEKRKALITQAVTRGLKTDVPMQDSGIEWLGEIPMHWCLVKIKHVAIVGNGSTPLRDEPSYWQGGSFPWLTSTVVNDDVVDIATEFVTEDALLKCHLPIVEPNSVLVAITGQGKTRGKAALLKYQATINQHIAFITPSEKTLNPHFLQLFLTSAYDNLRMISEGMGSTKGALTCEQIGDFMIPLPSLLEQQEIISNLQKQIQCIDALSSIAIDTMALLQERRTSLIFAAVTDQIQIAD